MRYSLSYKTDIFRALWSLNDEPRNSNWWGKRTPFGDFGKSLRDTPLSQLATHAANAALMDAKVEPTEVDHLVWGNVLPVDPDGFYTGRVAALNVGMPEESCALQVTELADLVHKRLLRRLNK